MITTSRPVVNSSLIIFWISFRIFRSLPISQACSLSRTRIRLSIAASSRSRLSFFSIIFDLLHNSFVFLSVSPGILHQYFMHDLCVYLFCVNRHHAIPIFAKKIIAKEIYCFICWQAWCADFISFRFLPQPFCKVHFSHSAACLSPSVGFSAQQRQVLP